MEENRCVGKHCAVEGASALVIYLRSTSILFCRLVGNFDSRSSCSTLVQF